MTGNPLITWRTHCDLTALLYGVLKVNYKVIVINNTVIIPPFNVEGFRLVNIEEKHSHFGQQQDYVFMQYSVIKRKCKNYHNPPMFENARINEKAGSLTVDGINFKLPQSATMFIFYTQMSPIGIPIVKLVISATPRY